MAASFRVPHDPSRPEPTLVGFYLLQLPGTLLQEEPGGGMRLPDGTQPYGYAVVEAVLLANDQIRKGGVTSSVLQKSLEWARGRCR